MSAERYEIKDNGASVRCQKPGKGPLILYACDQCSSTQKIIAVIRQLLSDNAALKDVLADEVSANHAFRKEGGARDDEDMPTFCARLIAERDALRARLAAIESESATMTVGAKWPKGL